MDKRDLIYIVGPSGAGKTWIGNQLDPSKYYVIEYDKFRRKGFLEVIKTAPIDKQVVVVISVKITTFKKLLEKDFNIRMLLVYPSLAEIKTNLLTRGGKITKSLDRRYKRFSSFQSTVEFAGDSTEVLNYLVGQNRHSIKHGMYKTNFYHVWQGIKLRCLNPSHRDYPNYGGRGITVQANWVTDDGFQNFKNDMYESYILMLEKYGTVDIDRIDNDREYSVQNCRWIDRQTNIRNRRISPVTQNYEKHMYWKQRFQCGLSQVLLLNCKSSRTIEPLLGCSILEFRKYIEAQFEPWMNWDNRGRLSTKQITWQIDHIIPCNQFDLSKEEDRKKCFYYTNLRPLEALKNRKRNEEELSYGKIT